MTQLPPEENTTRKDSLAQDGLLNTLLLLTRLDNKKFTANELTAGLPLRQNHLTPKIFPRAAARAGYAAKVARLKLKKLKPSDLPVVILLDGGQAALVLKENRATGEFLIRDPYAEGQEKVVNRSQLESHYQGYLFKIKPIHQFDQRIEDRGGSQHGWFRRALMKSWRIYRDVLISSFMINVFALASPLFIMNVYDRVVPNHALETLWVLVIGVLIVFLFDLMLRGLRSYFLDMAGKKTDIDLSAKIFQKVLDVKMAARPSSVGAFANHLDEFESIRNFITSATISTFIDLPFIFLFLFAIWFVGNWIVLVPLVAIPMVLIYALLMQSKIRQAVENESKGAAQKNATLVESLIGVETIKTLGAESQLQHKWEEDVEYIADWRVKSRRYSTSVVNFSIFMQQITTLGVVAAGVYLIAQGGISLGGLIAAVILSGRAMAPMAQVANLATHYHQTRRALRTLDQIMELPGDRESRPSLIHHPNIKGEIEFEKVSFRYPNQDENAINEVSLKLRAGEHLGIIGRTGSGKSTIEKLLLGLYQPDSGFVRIDGIDVGQIDPADVHSKIGYVPQDVMLFYGSVRDNVLFGNHDVNDEQFLKACELAGVTDIVHKSRQGFDMPIGERGQGLSGGQRQSIAIARALLRDPPILIMDEPTNAMDSKTEGQFKKKLADYMNGKTVILVTHKSSMLELVDRLLVLESGRVIADGSKPEVVQALQSGQVYA
jgi:ATP-binding cassette subfamily C protein LapB